MFLYLLPFISAIVVTVDKLQRAKPSLCVEHAAEHVFFQRAPKQPFFLLSLHAVKIGRSCVFALLCVWKQTI